jgi:hypothetical protein
MVQVKITLGLMQDLYKLKQSLAYFPLSLAYTKTITTGDDKIKIDRLLTLANANAGELDKLFTLPIEKHEEENRIRVAKNLQNIITATYEFIQAAEPVLQRVDPDCYNGPFDTLKKLYTQFMHTHLS